MPRKKQAAPRIEDAVDAAPATGPAAETAAPPPAQEPPAAAPAPDAVNPFPRNLRRADIGGTTIRLNQDQAANEMRIQFGSGQRADKPSDAVLDVIRREAVPEELKTTKERAEGTPVPLFKFRSDPDTGEGSWRMWMRNHPAAAREKAEQVFKAVVKQVAQDRGASPQR